jgi:hypothetical protein
MTAGDARPDDARQAQAVVDRAIRAHGGLERLAKTQLMIRKATGVMSLFGQDVPFSDELILQLPQRWRLTLEAGPAGQKAQFLLIVNDKQAWQSDGSAVAEVAKERLGELREEAYLLWLTTLVPLKKESGFTLATSAGAKVHDQEASVIKVARQGHAEIKLYFDKQTGLLIKAEHQTRDAGLEVTKEYVYSGHKEVEGVQLPTKSVELTNGKKLTELSTITYKFPAKVEESIFAKP